ncbi:hypothetical protein B0H19DRAFT_1112475 [Mycena capillaripes]|nr:hypothetical protein B0H19DRAFT_1112475 [Mycena capillaripes]
MASIGNPKQIWEALSFTSALIPHPQETKHLRDNLRANCLGRETTRFRATVSSAPADLALYEKHLIVLCSAQENYLPDIVILTSYSTNFFPSESAIADAVIRMRAESKMLSEYSAICSSALSPIRRLPSEILIHVFLLCTPVTMALNSEDYAAEIKRLAHYDLLQLAHVCAHWHALALGTPALWRELDMDLFFWSQKMLPFVQKVLERSASSPLQVRLGAPDAVTVDSSLLELIAQHCSRWKAALFYMDFAFYTSFSSIHGHLPLLECAHLAGLVEPDDSAQAIATAAVELFSIAPRLVDVTYAGPAKALQSLPWTQLKRFEYLDVHSFEISDALSVLQYFPPGMEFVLRRMRMLFPSGLLSEEPTPTQRASDLTELTVEFASHSAGAIANILRRLILPCLVHLEVMSVDYKDSHHPITWDHPAFQAFCLRSGCHKTLTTLYLLHVALSPAELLDCLAGLTVLEALVVADHPAVADKPEHVLLTDDVLRRLAVLEAEDSRQMHTPRLLPKLGVFGCLALLRFDETVYLDFVRSRLVVDGVKKFESHVRWHPGSERDLDPAVLSALRWFSEEKKFEGSIEEANEVEMQIFFY